MIMEYLDERFPEPPLLPAGREARARARLAVFRFDDLLGDDYYALRRGEANAVPERLEALPVGESLFVDFAYLPWVMRLREVYGVHAARPARGVAPGARRAAGGRCRARDRPGAGMTDIDVAELSSRLGEVTVLDVRTLEEYDGTLGNACDPRQGHIPGAVHFRVEELVSARPTTRCSERLGLADGAEVVAYCHSGSRSATAVQILRALGYDARNYSGSWHEWSRTDLPLENSESTHPE